MLQNLRTKSVMLLAVVLLAGQSAMAQYSDAEYKFSKRAVNDLSRGIQSPNEGLKKSSIYFAGIYQVQEAVDPLIEQLEKEEDAEVRVLIALVLYRIGDSRGLEAVKNLSLNDENARVVRMSKAILQDFDLTRIDNKGSLTWMMLNAE